MRKIFVSVFVAVATLVSAAYAGTPITREQLPDQARNFITKYFASDNVKKVEKEQGRRGMEYEVEFTNGAEIDFREDGSWKDVKAPHGGAIPADIVPAAINKYVQDHHAGQTIVEISRKRGGYEIELTNDVELKLTEDAKPLTGQEHKRRGNRR